MRLLPALLLSAAVHASVLALAAPQPAVEDLRLEVAIHLEAAGHGKGGRTEDVPVFLGGQAPGTPGRKEARRPVQPPPPEPVMAAPIPAPKPRQPLNAAAPPVEPRARKPIRTATPKAKPPEPPRDSIHTATSAQTPPSDQTAPSARGAAPARTHGAGALRAGGPPTVAHAAEGPCGVVPGSRGRVGPVTGGSKRRFLGPGATPRPGLRHDDRRGAIRQ